MKTYKEYAKDAQKARKGVTSMKSKVLLETSLYKKLSQVTKRKQLTTDELVEIVLKREIGS